MKSQFLPVCYYLFSDNLILVVLAFPGRIQIVITVCTERFEYNFINSGNLSFDKPV